MKVSLEKFFRRYFVLLLLLWILLVLYPNPLKLAISLKRLIEPPIDPSSITLLIEELPSTSAPQAIEDEVLGKITYRYDWEVYGMPWYFPTTSEAMAKGEGDCKARALILASALEAKGIPYRINVSPIHIWVDYDGKPDNSVENTSVQFYQQDVETGQRSLKLPHIPFSDVWTSFWDSFWGPMPVVRKVLLILGLVILIITRFMLSIRHKPKTTSKIVYLDQF